jgi:hypothetical protein
MAEIKFPSLIGISAQGDLIVSDSKGRYRKLKNFNQKTGRKTYKDGEYYGPVVRKGMFSVSVDEVQTFGEWLQKRNKKDG